MSLAGVVRGPFRLRLRSAALADADSLRDAGTDGLTPQQVEFQKVAKDFADREMLPHAPHWDEHEIFPHDVLKEHVARSPRSVIER